MLWLSLFQTAVRGACSVRSDHVNHLSVWQKGGKQEKRRRRRDRRSERARGRDYTSE